MNTFSSRIGVIDLVQCPLSIDNEHQIRFNTIEEQNNYFDNLHGTTVQNFNLVKFNAFNYIDIPVSYLDVSNKNYCRIQNFSIDSKWYFYFIEKFEFVNDNVTRIFIKTDVFQTYQFDLEFNKTFIERQTVSVDYFNSLNDEPSEGTLTEYAQLSQPFTGGYFIFCNADVTQDDTTSSTPVTFKIGNFSVPSYVLFYRESQADSMAVDMQKIANNGRADRINSAVYVPFLADYTQIDIQTHGDMPFSRGSDTEEQLLKKQITFDFSNFNPLFKKELCFPYAIIQVQDLTTGQVINLEPNRFDLDEGQIAKFEIQGTISETPSYKIIPMNYKGQTYSYSDSMVIKCNTSLPVLNNSYAKYLMNNQEMNNLKMLGGGVGIGYSLLNKSPMGAFSGFESIANVMLQEEQAKKQPNQLTAITDGALERLLFNNGIKIRLFVMDNDHKEMARGYWNMYGYPVKKLLYPSLIIEDDKTHKFIKTLDCNLNANIPQTDLLEISNLFNRGITLWKYDSFRNY